jgi:hypothetical protein
MPASFKAGGTGSWRVHDCSSWNLSAPRKRFRIARRKRRISVRIYRVGVEVVQPVKRIVTFVEAEKVDAVFMSML